MSELVKNSFGNLLKRKRSDKDLPLVTSVNFEALSTPKESITTKPIVCSKCPGVLTDPGLVTTDPNLGTIFICPYCETVNVIDLKDLPKGSLTDIDFMIEPVQVTTDGVTKVHIGQEEKLMSIIDVSGSMSDGKLDAVKNSLLETINDLEVNTPNSLFGLISFESSVYLFDSTGKVLLKVTGKDLHSMDHIASAFGQVDISKVITPIKKTAKNWREIVSKLNHMDMTALGPALLGGITLLKQVSGSKRIVLLTDGLANQGIGTLERPSPQGKNFYKKLSDLSLENDVIVDVVGVRTETASNEMGLDVLGDVADKTGGNIYFVSSKELGSAFEKMRGEEFIARDVHLNVLTPKEFETNEYIGVTAPSGPNEPVRLGGIRSGREIYVKLKPKKELKKASVPLQTQIKYRDKEGNLRLRVITNDIETTEIEEDFKKKYDSKLAATMAVQEAGDDYYQSGNLLGAKAKIKNIQMQFSAAGESVESEPVMAVLDEKLKEMEEGEEEAQQVKAGKSMRTSMAQNLKRLSKKRMFKE